MTIRDRIDRAAVKYVPEMYRKIEPSSAQKSLWDEDLHPRDEIGEFAAKSSPKSSEVEQTAEQAISDYKENGIRAKSFKLWFGPWDTEPSKASKVVKENGEPQETSPIDGSGSKVMKDGKPVTVYHGTAHGGFEAFDKSKVGDGNLYGPGFYFTEDQDIADSYMAKGSGDVELKPEQWRAIGSAASYLLPDGWTADTTSKNGYAYLIGPPIAMSSKRTIFHISNGPSSVRDMRTNIPEAFRMSDEDKSMWHKMLDKYGIPKGEEIKQCYLNIRKPFDIDSDKVPLTGSMREDSEAFVATFKQMLADDPNDKFVQEEIDTYSNNLKNGIPYADALGMFGSAKDPKESLNEHLRSFGYDGITHIGGRIMGDKEHRVWIAFEPNQVKSVDNQGTFDPKDDRMHYSMQERIERAADRYAKQREFNWDETRVVRDESGKFDHWQDDGVSTVTTEPVSSGSPDTADAIIDESYAKMPQFLEEAKQSANYREGDENVWRTNFITREAVAKIHELSEEGFVRLMRHENRKNIAYGNAIKLLGRCMNLGAIRAKKLAETVLVGISPSSFSRQHYSPTGGTNQVFGPSTGGVTSTTTMIPTEDVYRAIHKSATAAKAQAQYDSE